MKKIKLLALYVLGFPKSIYVCLRLCKFRDAIKIPIIVSHKTRLVNLSGSVSFLSARPGLVRIGFGSVETYDFRTEITLLSVPGHIFFRGKAKIGKASKISVQGELDLGKNFHVSAAATIICRKKIIFGDNCLVGWESIFSDADHHHIVNESGQLINHPKDIVLGNHVWVGAYSLILKGAVIGSDSVVAAKSVVNKAFIDNGLLIAGSPAKVIKKNINWIE